VRHDSNVSKTLESKENYPRGILSSIVPQIENIDTENGCCGELISSTTVNDTFYISNRISGNTNELSE
jgi:hypothetical protein